jgi:hypothetical protein
MGNYLIVADAASRPGVGSRYVGQMIYQADVGINYVWTGGVWRRVGPVGFHAAGSAASGFSTVETTACTLTVPDQGCAGRLFVNGLLRTDKTVSTDVFEVRLKDAGVQACFVQSPPVTLWVFSIAISVAMVAGAGKSITMTILRTSGSGTTSIYVDSGSTANFLDGIFVPS